MNDFQEKIAFGLAAAFSTMFSTLGAMFTTGETRWVYVTFAISTLTSGFLSLMCRKSDQTIQLTIGRFGFAILGGVLLTKPAIHHFGYTALAETDIIALAGLSALCCIVTFTVGVSLLFLLEKSAPSIAEKWFKKFQ